MMCSTRNDPDLDHATGGRPEKAFATPAGFALVGHALHRSSLDEGRGSYYAQRWGLVRILGLEDARSFLTQVGGAP